MQSALSAVKALVQKLGSFLSPYLGSLLSLLLRKGLVAEENASRQLAESTRSLLSSAVPARLLLPVLLKHLPSAAQVRLLS